MCLLLLAVKQHPVFDLILAGNRDEFYDRPTAAINYWQDFPSILGGRDLKGGGTWLALNRLGRIAAVTNFRNPSKIKSNARSRGNLPTEYLLSPLSTGAFLEKVRAMKDEFNDFNLILVEGSQAYYFSSITEEIRQLEPGIYGMSNHLLDTPWPKVVEAKRHFDEILSVSSEGNLFRNTLNLLQDRGVPPDNLLPDTGIGLEWERKLSSLFVHTDNYGTRSSSIIAVKKAGVARFLEQQYQPSGNPLLSQEFEIEFPHSH